MATGPLCDLVPDELLLCALDYLDLAELLGLMLVSKRWRTLAIEHPTYWQDLSLPLSDSKTRYCRDVALFRTRLSRSKSRPVTVSFHLVPSAPAAHALLGDLPQHLSHISSLEINASADFAEPLFDALHTPAPILQYFRLFLRPSSTGFAYPVEMLRHDIFDSEAPALKTASFFNLCLPMKFAPGLAAVEELELGCSWLWMGMMTPTVFEWLPRLRSLTLTGDIIIAKPPEGWETNTWESLESLVFNDTPISHAWHGFNLPITNLVDLSVRHGDAVSIAALADQLHGPLRLTVAFFPESEEVDMTMSANDGNVRNVSASLTEDPEDHVLREIANLAGRLTLLSIPISAWALVARAFGQLPHVAELEILVLSASDVTPSTTEGVVSCPSLRRVTLGTHPKFSDSPVAVALEDIAGFLSDHVVEAPLPVSLCLVNIASVGSAQAFADTFELVSAC